MHLPPWDRGLPQLTDVSAAGSPETFTVIRKGWPKGIWLRLPCCLGSPGKWSTDIATGWHALHPDRTSILRSITALRGGCVLESLEIYYPDIK